MPRPGQFRRWLIAASLIGAVLVVWTVWRTTPSEPVYQGRRLSDWMEGHPRDYHPAMQAIGTNALPFLLGEMRSRDSALSQLGQRLLKKISMGPPWRTAKSRKYHAHLALQILDSNAAPALLETVFTRPMRVAEGDPGWEAASALSWLPSPEAQRSLQERLARALRDPDLMLRRNACLAFAAGMKPGDENAAQIIALTRDPDATVRAAALRALLFRQPNEPAAMPTLIACLNDEQAAVRRLAIEALAARGTNAVSAIPALRIAYPVELKRTNRTDDVDDVCRGPRFLSPEAMRWAIRDAIKAIAPNAPPPTDTPVP